MAFLWDLRKLKTKLRDSIQYYNHRGKSCSTIQDKVQLMGEDMAAVAEKYELGMYYAEKEFE